MRTRPALEALIFIPAMLGLALVIGGACWLTAFCAGFLLRCAYQAARWIGLGHSPALVLGVLAVAAVVGWLAPKTLRLLLSRVPL